ncbi:hypothetical protein BP6252_07135 [Coleophoma cylindrospora]|uniref:SH3 domain-containing protein n=1 Tax=Coleophoma cylindrospora TaxID=1849047 RepID=A0A3D8RH18_9HELO|nr:hypothetical protein BP6252_07135 [Coleophoma cylindrospora]
MAEVMSPTLDTSASPATSPITSPSSNPNHPILPPLVTSPPQAAKRSNLQRPTSYAKNRMSQYSTHSAQNRSRPPSHVFPFFHSSLSYTIVRDFAYPTADPMHFGPPPEPSQPPSGLTTPASESGHGFQDPPASWDTRGEWSSTGWLTEGFNKGEQLAPMHFGDGPPWSEDEDLQSPVVVSSRHRKHKSASGYGSSHRGRGRTRREDGERTTSMLSRENYEDDRGYFVGSGGDGSERYYVNQGEEAGGPGGEIVTYPAEQARRSSLAPYNTPGQRDSHFAGTLPNRSYMGDNAQDFMESDASSSASSPGMTRNDESRYSRDYQFTIASPDEEMHGKAVALFDFERENENELPLVEGQVIWVSYRHGQGWLVAEDPKTQESGLVPEEYVRLLRDIQGGLNSLTGQVTDQLLSPIAPDSGTPTQADHNNSFGHAPTGSNGSNGYQQPILSTFSTSSKDLHPYPPHLLGTQAGQAPPQVIHYHGQRGGSQANTPTLPSSLEGSRDRSASQDARANKTESSSTTPVGTLPGAKMDLAAVQLPESPASIKSESSESSTDEKETP